MIAERIKNARLAAGLSQDEVIRNLNGRITKAALSNYENGKRTPHAMMLRELGNVYKVRPQWFMHEPEVSIQWHAYRAATTLGARKRAAIEAMAAQRAENYMEVSRLFPLEQKSHFPPRKAVGTFEEADQCATDLRKQWALGRDALESATQCLENHGALIVHYNEEPRSGFDGLSATVNGGHPLVIVNSTVPVDRLRFDLLHELGHVLMDTSAVGDDKVEETLANRFAASFLVPPETVKAELGEQRRKLTLSELLLLKQKYGLSVGAWVYAAKEHGIINETTATALWIQRSKRGWNKCEPAVFIGNEEPSRLRQMALRAVTDGLLSAKRAIELVPEVEAELREEGLITESRAMRFAALSHAEKQNQMRQAAEAAAADYAEGGVLAGLQGAEGDGIDE
jgi:Zn-dependent peptidase ImmA (M78 family)/transcriptional regulator with XRE-family HTH domain